MASIHKTNTISKEKNIIVLCYKLKMGYGLSPDEFQYLKTQHEKNEKKTFSFDRLNHHLVFVIADSRKEKIVVTKFYAGQVTISAVCLMAQRQAVY